jgi:hypothetical protein
MRGISLNSDQYATQNLASAPLAVTFTYGKRFKLDEILVNFSQAVTETVTITMISKNGVNYNVVLDTIPTNGSSSCVFRPQGEANFQAGDSIEVQCTNANGVGVAYCTIKSSQLGSGG